MSETILAPRRPQPAAGDAEAQLLARLRRGDEAAFVTLVQQYSPLMHRIALGHVRSRAVAEEVVQETWLAVLAGLGRFEARSCLRTWILRILANRAKTRGERERRSVPLSCLGPADGDGPTVDPDRFQGPDGRFPGGWAAFPTPWEHVPEERLVAQETLARVRAAMAALPARQQDVIVLRDVEGWSSEEVCHALGLSDGNQRVLLHRARSRVRAELERYLEEAA